MQDRNKPLILFVAEAITLAHFARIVALAKALDPSLYNIVVASDPRYLGLEASFNFTYYPIYTIPATEFAQAISQGKPLYNFKTLIRYVEDDLALLDEIKPDLVVGDFRLSLAVSAPLRKVPYAAVVNAYWSPFADIINYPIPDLTMTRILGSYLAQKLFNIVRPIAFALHAKPFNQVRQRFGLPPLGTDLRQIYTWGNYTLYADSPDVVSISNLPYHHYYLGPILWSAQTPLPVWWNNLPEAKPVVFLTLGSSGQAELLPMVLAALSRLSVSVIVATAGKIALADVPANAYIADYLPMNIVTQRAQLLISNGGSLTTYQALVSGVPIIGLCSNMDQLLNMGAVERLGAGLVLRAAKVTFPDLLAAVAVMLNKPSYKQAAGRLSQLLREVDARKSFQDIVGGILSERNESGSYR